MVTTALFANPRQVPVPKTTPYRRDENHNKNKHPKKKRKKKKGIKVEYKKKEDDQRNERNPPDARTTGPNSLYKVLVS